MPGILEIFIDLEMLSAHTDYTISDKKDFVTDHVDAMEIIGNEGRTMVVNEFFFTSRVGKWYVDNHVDCHGPYLSQWDATADAIDAAKQVSARKKPTAVLLKLPGSKATVIWSSRQAMREAASAVA